MGLGGGGSLLGGSSGVGGGAEGPGLDLLTLLNQLTQGAGTAGAPGQSLLRGIEPTSLGFGAGGALLRQQGGVPQGTLGQAGAGGGQSSAAVLGLLKEAVGLGKTLLGGSKTSSPTGGLGGTADILRGTGDSGAVGPDIGQFTDISGAIRPEFLVGGSFIGPDLGQFTDITGAINPAFLGGAGQAATLAPGAISAPFLAGGGPEAVGRLAEEGGGFFSGTGGIGAAIGALGGILGALNASNDISKAGSALGAAGSIGSFFDPTGISQILALIGGGTGLLGGLFGHPGIFEARRKNVGPTAQAGESALAGALTQGLDAMPGIQSLPELLAALGVPTPDTFGGPRNPVGVSIGGSGAFAVPKDLSEFLLGGPTQNVGPLAGIDFEFNPNRVSAGAELATPAVFQRFLEKVKTNPSLLDLIQGSGDVAFQNQAASEALAARVRLDAQNAIRRFLGLPMPAAPPPVPSAPAVPTSLGSVLGRADDEFFTGRR